MNPLQRVIAVVGLPILTGAVAWLVSIVHRPSRPREITEPRSPVILDEARQTDIRRAGCYHADPTNDDPMAQRHPTGAHQRDPGSTPRSDRRSTNTEIDTAAEVVPPDDRFELIFRQTPHSATPVTVTLCDTFARFLPKSCDANPAVGNTESTSGSKC